MFSKLRKTVPERDQVVIIEDNNTADIAQVYDSDDQAIYAASTTQDYAIPLGDVKSYVGPTGRIYLLAAEPDYVRETKRLAALEKSIVLRQITHYQRDVEDKERINIRQILLYAMIGILLLAVVFK